MKTYYEKSNWYTKTQLKNSGKSINASKFNRAKPILSQYARELQSIISSHMKGKISKLDAQRKINKLFATKRASFQRLLR